MGQIATTVSPLNNGQTAVTGVGKKIRLELTGTWATDDWLRLLCTEVATGLSEAIGHGPVTGIAPVYLKTYRRKLYQVAGTNLHFSALDLPAVFNAVDTPGNSFIELANEYGFADDLLAIGIFRRLLAVFGSRHVQLWNVDPDPAQNLPAQTLENEGTVNGKSVRGLGTLDLLYCAPSGVRSLAARVNSEDAEVSDIGEPVDALVQADLSSYGAAGLCSIVEPRTRRYWLGGLGTRIYVLSYFRQAGVAAWSQYAASYDASGDLPPSGANYDGFGSVTYSGLIVGNTYTWTKGANDVNITCGSTSRNTTGTFVATATTATGWGLTGQPVTATLNGTYTVTFTPEEFVVFDGQIYVRATNGQIFRYGGADDATYDYSVCSWETPWHDARSPGTEKQGRGIDTGMEGRWVVKLGTDSESGSPLREILNHTTASFRLGSIGAHTRGTHFKARGESRGNEYARFAAFIYHWDDDTQR